MRPKRLSNWLDGQHLLDLTSLSSTMTFDPRPCEVSASWANACARPNVSVTGAPRDGGYTTIEGSLAASVPCGTTRVDRVLARPPPPLQTAKWALKVETANSSNWCPAKSWLSMADASVVLLQEHHLPPDRCDEARVWCRKGGWKALFSPALQGDKDDNRSWTAGVAILVRDSLGLARWTAGLQEPVTQFLDDGIVPGRLVAGFVTLLDGVAIAVGSGYWFSSQGLKECNLRLFSVVCQFASATTLDFIVGGDFQVEKALAQNLERFAMSGLVLKAADRNKTALCRLWAKCCTTMAQSLENLNPRPYFAASKGRVVTDPIWRHAVAVGCGVGQGDETVSVWRDFAKFYDRMEHHILQANPETFCFPLLVLRVAVSAYKMQRVLVLHGEAAHWTLLKGSGSWMCHRHLPGQTVLLACVGQCCAPVSSCFA